MTLRTASKHSAALVNGVFEKRVQKEICDGNVIEKNKIILQFMERTKARNEQKLKKKQTEEKAHLVEEAAKIKRAYDRIRQERQNSRCKMEKILNIIKKEQSIVDCMYQELREELKIYDALGKDLEMLRENYQKTKVEYINLP